LTTWRATEGGKGGLAPAPRPVVEAVESVVEEAADPLASVLLGHAGDPTGPDERLAVGDGQDDAAAASEAVRRGSASESGKEGLTFLGREGDDQL
jgi:hypothetical protein